MRWGEGVWEGLGRMDLSFQMGRGTGSQSTCTDLERKRRTVPLLRLDLQTLRAGKGLRVHTPLCTIHTHHISACERQAHAACWEPHMPSAGALSSGITHTHTYTHAPSLALGPETLSLSTITTGPASRRDGMHQIQFIRADSSLNGVE